MNTDPEFVDHIDHKGIITSVNTKENTVTVRVDDAGDCGSCPAATLCNVNGSSSNTIVVPVPDASIYKRKDIVTVRGTERMHRKAITLATVLPCIILIAVMVGVYLLTWNQLAAALSGLFSTVVVFVILYACRNKIAHEFPFEIVGRD